MTTPQSQWRQIIDDSVWTYAAVIREFELCQSSFNNWIHLKVEASEKSRQRMEDVLKKVAGRGNAITFHKAYGYATEEQIKKLQSIGLGPDRDYLLKQIAKQTETKGKTKF